MLDVDIDADEVMAAVKNDLSYRKKLALYLNKTKRKSKMCTPFKKSCYASSVAGILVNPPPTGT